MSGMQASGVVAAGCSSALPHQQKQEVTVAGFSDEAVAKIIKAYNDSQKMEQAELDHHRGWLMALATLIASVTYTAALSPPGGFWGADDKANGYVAGTPVFRDKFPRRYTVFYYCNVTSFASSLSIIVMLSSKFRPTDMYIFNVMGSVAFIGLAAALLVGSATNVQFSIFSIVLMLLIVLLYPLRVMLRSSIVRGNRAA